MTSDYLLDQYSLFGIIFFMGILGYLMIENKAFNIKIKLFKVRLLMAMIIIFIALQFIFIESLNFRILNGLILILSSIAGYFLIKSVQKENEHKKELKMMKNMLAVANDKLRKLDKSKSEFISIASHQLRTPLTSIKGFISLLLEGAYGKMDKRQQDVLSKVYISNERLANLVEDLLNISRIESGKMEFKFRPWKIENICLELADIFSIQAREKNLYLEYNYPAVPLPEIMVDGNKIREVISNLLDNAIKYTSRGGVKMRIEVINNENQEKENSGQFLRITISDTGIGIPADELPYLFTKFSRGKNINRLSTAGTGLGLYVGKSLIEANSGRIWAESKGEGTGSKFIIEFPVKQSKDILKKGE